MAQRAATEIQVLACISWALLITALAFEHLGIFLQFAGAPTVHELNERALLLQLLLGLKGPQHSLLSGRSTSARSLHNNASRNRATKHPTCPWAVMSTSSVLLDPPSAHKSHILWHSGGTSPKCMARTARRQPLAEQYAKACRRLCSQRGSRETSAACSKIFRQ